MHKLFRVTLGIGARMGIRFGLGYLASKIGDACFVIANMV